MRNAKPSQKWLNQCTKSFRTFRKTDTWPNRDFASGLYRQGYTARQSGKLCAFLAMVEDGEVDAFDWYNAGPGEEILLWGLT